MPLDLDELKLFFRLYGMVLFFVNQRLGVEPGKLATP